MKFNILVAIFFTFFCASGFAENTEKDEKLRELVAVMDMDSMIDSIYSQMDSMTQNMAAQMGIKPSEKAIFDKYNARMTKIIKENMSWEKMEPMVLAIYQNNFTEKEIEDMLAFYKTESGQSLLKKMPNVVQESMLSSQQLIQQSMPKIQAIAMQLQMELEQTRKKDSTQ